MKPTAIYLDMDDVLVDFSSPFVETMTGVTEIDGRPVLEHISYYGWILDFVNQHREKLGAPPLRADIPWTDPRTLCFWKQLAAYGPEWWEALPWTVWGRDILDICVGTGLPIVLMSKPTIDPMSLAGKKMWMNKNLPSSLWEGRFSLTGVKHHMAHAGAFLIDDSPKTVEQFREHEGQGFLWPMPYTTDDWSEATVELALTQLEEELSG